jgi:hypothetical protein
MTEPVFTPKHNPHTGITSYTINPPEYRFNQQGQREMTLNGYEEVEPMADAAPKRKRGRKKKAEPPAIQVDLDAVQDIVEQDLIKRGMKNPIPTDTE